VAAVIGGFLATLAGSVWARTALRYGVAALAILPFLPALRRVQLITREVDADQRLAAHHLLKSP
jgi:hypothetical protein